jgi:adenylylsulfate kinase
MIVYLKCPLNIAIQREMKREDTKEAPNEIYEKAIEGKSETVPGIQSDYEEPLDPEIVIQSDKVNVQDGAKKIFKRIKSKFL